MSPVSSQFLKHASLHTFILNIADISLPIISTDWQQFLKVVLMHASTEWTIDWKQNTDWMLEENLKHRNGFSVLAHTKYKYIEL